IHTLGAGGGSIAHVDAGGILHVGPESAGADPGPACYGKGGDRATVTDANVVLGFLDPGNFLGGRSTPQRPAPGAAGGRAARARGSAGPRGSGRSATPTWPKVLRSAPGAGASARASSR